MFRAFPYNWLQESKSARKGNPERKSYCSGEVCASIDHSDRLIRQAPFLNELTVGAISLQLVKGGFHCVKHRGIIFANDDAFQARFDNRTTNGKLTRVLLVVVVCYRQILIR